MAEIPGIDLARADVAQVAKQWLEGRDSGDDPYECDDDAQEPLSNFFPGSIVGSILLTTRNFAVANRFASERNDAIY
ncbi:uncharacterized protein A1O5_12199 [Cladophialophora psammophila CBS 110553]|uniref:Uncharacterized protein n=1 Tax=Cladophialophora psammophila CBS 110553 TaxID=1182543 RepID=W9VUQ5_9EURO|nr:uncharacterized protein A1O5_12199 [Cladophialophora psammophila CBS 110553]EXJ59318.1 hypothetical protein A1O5_12199 [Cladophialophora psammophila CBS 110553]